MFHSINRPPQTPIIQTIQWTATMRWAHQGSNVSTVMWSRNMLDHPPSCAERIREPVVTAAKSVLNQGEIWAQMKVIFKGQSGPCIARGGLYDGMSHWCYGFRLPLKSPLIFQVSSLFNNHSDVAGENSLFAWVLWKSSSERVRCFFGPMPNLRWQNTKAEIPSDKNSPNILLTFLNPRGHHIRSPSLAVRVPVRKLALDGTHLPHNHASLAYKIS